MTSNEPRSQNVKPIMLAAAGLLIAGAVAFFLMRGGSKSAEPPSNQQKVNPKDGLVYVWIPAGKFMMGCSTGDTLCGSDEEPAHEVTLTQGFWIGQTEVTQEAYQRVTGTNPSFFKGVQLPVEQVRWEEAQAFCGTAGLRLPTEAEWEYAAGADSAGPGNLNAVAWTVPNSDKKTHPVGQKRPNRFGLVDMLGNVSEYVADWYKWDHYKKREGIDPQGPVIPEPELLDGRVRRGGNWYYEPRYARISARGISTGKDYDTGFRCAGGSEAGFN